MCSVPYKGKEKYKVKVFVYVKIKKRGTFFKLTTPPYRNPLGTSFARPSFDQPLSALSILIVKLTTLAFRNPRGATGAALRVTFWAHLQSLGGYAKSLVNL